MIRHIFLNREISREQKDMAYLIFGIMMNVVFRLHRRNFL